MYSVWNVLLMCALLYSVLAIPAHRRHRIIRDTSQQENPQPTLYQNAHNSHDLHEQAVPGSGNGPPPEDFSLVGFGEAVPHENTRPSLESVHRQSSLESVERQSSNDSVQEQSSTMEQDDIVSSDIDASGHQSDSIDLSPTTTGSASVDLEVSAPKSGADSSIVTAQPMISVPESEVFPTIKSLIIEHERQHPPHGRQQGVASTGRGSPPIRNGHTGQFKYQCQTTNCVLDPNKPEYSGHWEGRVDYGSASGSDRRPIDDTDSGTSPLIDDTDNTEGGESRSKPLENNAETTENESETMENESKTKENESVTTTGEMGETFKELLSGEVDDTIVVIDDEHTSSVFPNDHGRLPVNESETIQDKNEQMPERSQTIDETESDGSEDGIAADAPARPHVPRDHDQINTQRQAEEDMSSGEEEVDIQEKIPTENTFHADPDVVDDTEDRTAADAPARPHVPRDHELTDTQRQAEEDTSSGEEEVVVQEKIPAENPNFRDISLTLRLP